MGCEDKSTSIVLYRLIRDPWQRARGLNITTQLRLYVISQNTDTQAHVKQPGQVQCVLADLYNALFHYIVSKCTVGVPILFG